MDMGDLFPSARVRGIDLSPAQSRWVPPNVDFLVDDCEKDWLTHDIDFVHFRFMVIILKDVPTVLRRAHKYVPLPSVTHPIACKKLTSHVCE